MAHTLAKHLENYFFLVNLHQYLFLDKSPLLVISDNRPF